MTVKNDTCQFIPFILDHCIKLASNFYNVYVAVKVKWGKELYSDVEANTDEDPLVFKAQLFALTGVQPERQKVMVKGSTLKDTDWGTIKLANVNIKLVERLCLICLQLFTYR